LSKRSTPAMESEQVSLVFERPDAPGRASVVRLTRTPIPQMVREEAHSGNMLIGFEMLPWTTVSREITATSRVEEGSVFLPLRCLLFSGGGSGTHSSGRSFDGGNPRQLLRWKGQRSRSRPVCHGVSDHRRLGGTRGWKGISLSRRLTRCTVGRREQWTYDLGERRGGAVGRHV